MLIKRLEGVEMMILVFFQVLRGENYEFTIIAKNEVQVGHPIEIEPL